MLELGLEDFGRAGQEYRIMPVDSPRNIMERMVCIAIVLIAGLCWAYILGEARVSKMFVTPKVWMLRAACA